MHLKAIDGDLQSGQPKMQFVTRCALTLAYAFSAVALGSTSTIGNVSRVNSDVDVDQGQQAGDLSTVNGSVNVGADAHAGSVETVNGSVRIADRAAIGSAETVNGEVLVGEGAQVEGDLETVNGSMTLHRGARITGHLQNVNGSMVLQGAEVRGGLETVNGDIRLQTGTRVEGGIHVEDTHNNGWDRGKKSRNPKITVEQGVVLQGPLHFEREVDLYVAPGVTVPAVQGVQPRRYALN
jgi:hypothetical protein